MTFRPCVSWIARVALAALLTLAADAGRCQDDGAAKPWRLFEADRGMLDYRAELREGLFGEPAKAFLERTALPQLALPANRGTIDRVRRRMRDTLCGEAGGDRKAAEAAMRVVLDFMTRLARDEQAEMIVRVNAMLFVGDLKAGDQSPWPPAAAALAEAVGDERLPAAVRIAAAAGLDRHVEAAGAKLAPTVGPALEKVLTAPATNVDPAAAAWLGARCLEMLGTLGSAAPPAAAKTAGTILADVARPVDLRVRAAAALGRMAGVAKGLDFAGTRDAIQKLAVATLEADRAEAERWRFLESVRQAPATAPRGVGDGPVTTGTGQDLPLLPLACRRTAWRLATLADALLTADTTSGIGLAAGANRQAAADLAATLRQAATAIDTTPDADSIEDALKTITGGPAPGAAPSAAPAPATDQPDAPAPPPAADNPFGSPFGN
jgi:hypothetical protein